MFRLSMLGLAALLSGVAVSQSQAQGLPASPDATDPRRTIVIFGASWCAPCIAEIRNIAKVAAAAAPDHITIVWADSGIRRYSLTHRENIEIANERDARRLTALLAPDNAGLPYAAMINRQGRKCADWRGPLGPEDIVRIRASCSD